MAEVDSVPADVPKLNQLARKLFGKKSPESEVTPVVKLESKDASDEPSPPQQTSSEPPSQQLDDRMEAPVDDSEDDDLVELLSKPSRTERKRLPRRHRGAVGAIRLNQSRRTSVYRKTPLFRLVNQIVRGEMKRQGVQFSRDSVAMIATVMENLMYRKAAPGQLISLSSGKSSLLRRHAALGIKLQRKPDMRQWSAADFRECDAWLEKSQFRNTELDVEND